MSLESALLLPALGCYALAGATAWIEFDRRAPAFARATALLLAGGLALHTASLAARWQAVGHGPFTTMYEILSSNVWSLALVFALVWARVREVRAAALLVLPVILLLAAWLLAADGAPGHFPPTYFTALLYVHALLGKIYLGLLLAAVGVSGLVWLRRSRWGARRLAGLAPDEALDELAHRFAAFAFVFDSLMLIAGAVCSDDIEEVIEIGLTQIPQESRLAQAVRTTMDWARSNRNWLDTLDAIHSTFGHYHPVHTINNAALVIMGLLHGKLDLGKTICMTVMGGWDTDCNVGN
ncbi:hypothetical protein FBR04_19010, partial [Betaproteobacteria bacterium PRO7]|nr:hypothetical protein [Betaproteobacteria bacterium PRO7]